MNETNIDKTIAVLKRHETAITSVTTDECFNVCLGLSPEFQSVGGRVSENGSLEYEEEIGWRALQNWLSISSELAAHLLYGVGLDPDGGFEALDNEAFTSFYRTESGRPKEFGTVTASDIIRKLEAIKRGELT